MATQYKSVIITSKNGTTQILASHQPQACIPSRDISLEDAEVTTEEGKIKITGKLKVFGGTPYRLWLDRGFLMALYEEQEIRSGYKNLIDRLRGVKSFFVLYPALMKERGHFYCECTNYIFKVIS